MTNTRPAGLGRGLSALLPAATPGRSGLETVRVADIVPNPKQPRGAFDQAALEELAHSIRQVGLLQPVVARPLGDGRYMLIAGERRLRAARLAGLDAIPAVLRFTDDDQLLTEALVENIHRADLNPMEEAAAYQQLLDDFGFTHDVLARRLGRSRSAISNTLRLLSLEPSVQQLVAGGELSAGHARTLLALPDPEHQRRIAAQVLAEGLSVRATEAMVRQLIDEDGDDALDELAAAARKRASSPYVDLQERLGEALATRVRITGSARRGRVVIHYSGGEDLERLLDVLSRGTGHDLLEE